MTSVEQTGRRRTRRAVWLCTGAALLLCVAAGIVTKHDSGAAAWCASHTVWLERMWWFRWLKLLGKAPVQVVLIGAWAFAGGGRRAFLTGLLALVLVGVVVFPIKTIVHRQRPNETLKGDPLPTNDSLHSWSFPSGDTASAFAVSVALIPFLAMPWRVTLLCVSAAIAAARVMGLHHYPSDVLCGAAAGILCGLCAWLVVRRLMDRSPPK